MRVLYFTHCCAKKDRSLKGKRDKVTLMQLYKATPTQRFMKRCIDMNVQWAIFSDLYAFVFPNDRIQFYEKHPKTVTEDEKEALFAQACRTLDSYDTAVFYYNPRRLHPFYRELILEMRQKGKRILEITHLSEINIGH